LEQFVSACDLQADDVVVEVGGGTGVVTKAIAPLVKKLVTYELDESLAKQYLKPLESEFGNLEIKSEDIFEAQFHPAGGMGEIDIVCGAIPYQISSPLLHKVVREFYGLEKRSSVVFIMQKEVARKVCGKPPKATYFSNFVKLYGRAEVVDSTIPPSAFYPAPKVFSAILKITPYKNKPIAVEDFSAFEKFLHHGFKNPRKMINKVFDPSLLERAGISPNLRPQALLLRDWMHLFGIVKA